MNNDFLDKWVKAFFIAIPAIMIGIVLIMLFSSFMIVKDISNSGGIAKTLGTFVREFECAKNNNCNQPTNQ